MMLRALLTIGAAQFVTMLVLLVRTKTLAVVLGPELVGVMAVVDKWLALISQTASFSLPYAAVRFLPERWKAGPAEFGDLYARMRNLVVALLVAATVGALLVSAVYPAAWGEALLPYRDVVAVAILGLPVIGLAPFFQNAVAGRMQQNRSMAVGLAHAVVLTLCVAGVAWGGLAGYYAAYAVLGTLFVLAVNRSVVRDLGSGAPRASFSLPPPVWRFCAALLVLAFLAPCSALFVHYRLLSEHGAETAGWMQAAIGISLAVRAVMGSAHSVFLTPNVNQGGGPLERMQWADRYQVTLCLIGILVVPPVLLFPDTLVWLLYSSAFLPGAAFVAVFVIAEIVGLLSGTYQSLVVALDRMPVHVANNLVAQLLVIAAAWLWVGPYGILGAAAAMLLAPVYMFVATMVFLRRGFGLAAPREVAVRAAWLVGALVAAGLVGREFPEISWQALLAKALTYAAIVAGVGAMLTPHERLRVREAIARWRTA